MEEEEGALLQSQLLERYLSPPHPRHEPVRFFRLGGLVLHDLADPRRNRHLRRLRHTTHLLGPGLLRSILPLDRHVQRVPRPVLLFGHRPRMEGGRRDQDRTVPARPLGRVGIRDGGGESGAHVVQSGRVGLLDQRGAAGLPGELELPRRHHHLRPRRQRLALPVGLLLRSPLVLHLTRHDSHVLGVRVRPESGEKNESVRDRQLEAPQRVAEGFESPAHRRAGPRVRRGVLRDVAVSDDFPNRYSERRDVPLPPSVPDGAVRSDSGSVEPRRVPAAEVRPTAPEEGFGRMLPSGVVEIAGERTGIIVE
mmetsp:Transcript_47831/g.88710  ORF Transcript_47831/g.88710 Transcript_47831/m.88710 type:complete len:309 (-) Transcript_47831:347-1273(-)